MPMECSSCGSLPYSSQQFCRICGDRVICRQCQSRNIQNRVCRDCGVKLSDTYFIISDNWASDLWNYYSQYTGFAKLWSNNGYGWKVHAKVDKLFGEVSPSARKYKTAVAFPIASQGWCIRQLDWGPPPPTTYGAFYANTLGLIIVNLQTRRLERIPYEMLTNVNRKGDNITIFAREGINLGLTFRAGRPSKLATAWLVTESFINNFGSRDWSDQELARQNWQPKADEHRLRHENADAFVESLAVFLSDVIREKRKFFNELSDKDTKTSEGRPGW